MADEKRKYDPELDFFKSQAKAFGQYAFERGKRLLKGVAGVVDSGVQEVGEGTAYRLGRMIAKFQQGREDVGGSGKRAQKRPAKKAEDQ